MLIYKTAIKEGEAGVDLEERDLVARVKEGMWLAHSQNREKTLKVSA